MDETKVKVEDDIFTADSVAHGSSSVGAAMNRVKSCLNYSLKQKYGIENDEITEAILRVHGLSKKNLEFINNFESLVESKAEIHSEESEEANIDQNSNKSDVSVSGILVENATPIAKLLGYRYLYRKMVELYGKQRAKFLCGEMYDYSLALADSSNILKPYCFSINASRLVLEGRPFGKLHSLPPHRVSSYIACLNETVHQLSNHTAGALAIATLFLDCARVMLFEEHKTLFRLKHNRRYRKYIRNCLQNFVHSMNHLSRNSTESPFTNVSVFDKSKLRGLLDEDNFGWYFDLEKKPKDFRYFSFLNKKSWTDYCVEVISEIQDIFLDIMDAGDVARNGLPITFPVTTINISVDDDRNITEPKFVKKMCKHDIFRYNIFVSQGNKIASCCFDKNTKVLVRDTVNGIQELTLEEVYNLPRNATNFKVFHNGSFVGGRPVKIAREGRPMYRIVTANGKEIILTDNHINLVVGGEKKTSELTTDDYLMFNTTPIQEKSSNQVAGKGLTEAQGILIGAYLGDGSCYIPQENKGQIRTTFSLNLEKDKNLIPYFEQALVDIGEVDNHFTFHDNGNNCYSVNISSNKVYNFIRQFVSGKYCYDKSLNLDCINESYDFRMGIIKGHYLTDGGNSNRIYTTSEQLVKDEEVLFNSVGIPTVITCADRTNEKVIIREQEFNRNYPSWTIRWYNRQNKRSQEDLYKYFNGNWYFKINSIEKLENYTEPYVYCFEMKDESEPYFTLANGLVSHNCRLINDEDLFEQGAHVNSLGGGGSVSLGSHRVCTVNLYRIFLECDSFDDYLARLHKRLESCADILQAHKELIKDLTSRGLEPFIENGYLDLNRMFSTVGIAGFYEADKHLKEKFGDRDYLKEILEAIEDFNRKVTASGRGLIMNTEEIPAESMMTRLPKVDNMLFGIPEKIYSNQFVPLFEEGHNVFERMDLDGKYGKLLTGGGIVHITLGEKTTPEQSEMLIAYAAKAGCNHFALNPCYSICEHGHSTFGKVDVCPICGGKIVDYITRTIGYFSHVTNWTNSKRENDFEKRDMSVTDVLKEIA